MHELGGPDITQLLRQWQDGDRDAFDRLVPLVYEELRVLASHQLAREWRHDRPHTSTIVNEAYLRLFRQQAVDWQNRGQFFAVAGQMMRRILVDQARQQRRDKRGGGSIALALTDALPAPRDTVDAVDALDLDRALQKLERLDPNQGRIVELRYFAGLTVEETAAALGISATTVKREWALAKSWLYRELTGGAASSAED